LEKAEDTRLLLQKFTIVDPCSFYEGKIYAEDLKTKWTAKEMLNEAKNSYKNEKYMIAEYICQKIIEKQKSCPNFATKEELEKAQEILSANEDN